MEGFFTKKESELIARPNGKALSCISCGLLRKCNSPKMEEYGNFGKRIMIIGKAPSELDDKRGLPFQDHTGKLLQRTLSKLGIDLFEDCISFNATNCRGSYVPSNHEIDCCRKIVLERIERYKPRVIILLGNAAIYSVIGHRWKKALGSGKTKNGIVDKWRGWTIPDQDLGCWVCPTFHPEMIESSLVNKYKPEEKKDSSVEYVIWQQDLNRAIGMTKIRFPKYKEPKIEVYQNLTQFTEFTKRNILYAFDYECTGLKPHAAGHRIVTCSVARNPEEVCVFMFPENKREWRPFIDFIVDPNKGKCAHNFKYEENWSAVILGQPVKGWYLDTMLTSHLFDNRTGITSLKFQTYVLLGIVDYSSEIEPYLKAVDDKSANAFNRIDELLKLPGGKQKLMKYNAYDSTNEYSVAIDAMNIMKYQYDLPF